MYCKHRQSSMNQHKVGTSRSKARERTYKRPSWVKSGEERLCPECFKAVGDESRYKVICMLGKTRGGLTVGALTKELKLKQPTVTHHLQVLRSVDAVDSEERGRERVYTLNRGAHCFEECKI